MRIFKYTGHARAILQNRKIKLSLAHLLNDPFELSPRIDPAKITPRRTAIFLRQREEIERHYELEGLPRGVDFRQFRKWYLANIPARAASLMKNIPQNVEKAQENFAETFAQHWRLFCASKKKDSILMWSHYANEHRGAVIEFETAEKPFRNLGRDFVFEVQYMSEKANFDYDPEKTKPFMAAMLDVARRKSPEWSYEEEVRAVFPGVTDLFPIYPQAVKSLTFGCRCPQSEREAMNSLLSEKSFTHVSLFEAKLSKDSFRLDFDLIRAGI